MFGQSSTPFGSSQSTFGQTNSAPSFGQSSTPFGSPAPASSGFGGFGAPAPAPSAFGGFGSPAPAPSFGSSTFGAPPPAPSAFGSSTFGSSTTSSPFGVPAPAPSGGLFGTPAPAPSGGLFGAPAPAPSTGFGSTSFGFGSSPAPSAFGGTTFGAPAPAPSTGLFGAPAPANPTGGFGSSTFGAPAASAFGSPAPTSTGLFGAPAPAPSGGLFGAPAPTMGQGGTKGIPYQVTTRQDGTANINIQAITAMPAYESKSFDELRYEDYSQGNRGSASSTPAPAGGFSFGAPAPSSGLFGAPSPAPSFGTMAPSSSTFGSFGAPAPAPSFGFGTTAPAPAPFGAPAPSSIFGAPSPAPAFGGFGAKAPAPSTSLFGVPAPAPSTGLFGVPAPAPGGLFGSSTSVPSFGAPAPAPSTGLFGAPAPSTGLFGSTAPAPAFGSTPAPAPGAFSGFGSPAPAPSGLFGVPAPTSTFGATAPSTGLFGFSAPAPGGLFGTPAPASTTSLFGAPAPAPPSAFGALAAPAPSLFGAPAPVPVLPAAPPVGAIIPPAASDILAHQLAVLEKQRKEFEKTSVWGRGSPESSSTVAANTSEADVLSSLTPTRPVYGPYRASPHSKSKIRPRGFGSPVPSTPTLRSFGTRSSPIITPVSLSTSANTRLVVNPRPRMRLILDDSTRTAEESKLPDTNVLRISPAVASPRSPATLIADGDSKSTRHSSLRLPTDNSTPTPRSRSAENGSGAKKVGFDYYQQVTSLPDEAAGGVKRAPGTPSLTKEGYKCSPPIETLQTFSGEELAAVPNFSVEREGYGMIEWEGDVDVRGADLDRIVIIEQNTISMYMEEEEAGKKPAVGSKLNRAALLTFYNVYPKNGGAHADEETKAKFVRKIKKSTPKMGAELINYNPSTGVWRMRVQHFSRYGLNDDDSDAESEEKSNFESGERGGRSQATKGILKNRRATPYRASNVTTIEDLDDDTEDEAAIVSDMDMEPDVGPEDPMKAIEEAEAAYANIAAIMDTEDADAPWVDSYVGDFLEEVYTAEESRLIKGFYISPLDLHAASYAPSMCDRMAEVAGVKSSQTDFGLYIRRSFRVGWSPDGSFLSFAHHSGSRLVRRRPVLSNESGSRQVKLLEVHQAKSKESEESIDMEFCLPPSRGVFASNIISSYSEGLHAENDSKDKDISGDVYHQSISLLSCLQPGHCNDCLSIISADQKLNAFMYENRQLSAVCLWLIRSCAGVVDTEISEAKRRGRPCEAILAALSGGDMEKACAVACEMGCTQLACVLSSGPDAREDILKQARFWAESNSSSKLPEELIRIYFLLGGDLNMEKDIYRQGLSRFDWLRRLSMQITFNAGDSQASIPKLIRGYMTDVSAGVAPLPLPQYLTSQSNGNVQSTMFRLLNASESSRDLSLADIVDPSGYTDNVHDFALSFHLAAIATAVGYCKPMDIIEERHMIDGYVAQLLGWGLWEWAVYVSLCSFSKTGPDLAIWKEVLAKDLIMRHYDNNGPSFEGKRRRLEALGLPPEWFEEALAYRCFSKGEVQAHIRHTAAFSQQDACMILEETLIPNILFMGKNEIDASMNLVEAFAAFDGSLPWVIFTLSGLCKGLHQLEYASREEIDKALPHLSESCKLVEQALTAYKSSYEMNQGVSIQITPAFKKVPMECFLFEALSQIGLFKLQLRALQAGIPIRDSSTQLINLISSNEFDESMASRHDAARWFM